MGRASVPSALAALLGCLLLSACFSIGDLPAPHEELDAHVAPSGDPDAGPAVDAGPSPLDGAAHDARTSMAPDAAPESPLDSGDAPEPDGAPDGSPDAPEADADVEPTWPRIVTTELPTVEVGTEYSAFVEVLTRSEEPGYWEWGVHPYMFYTMSEHDRDTGVVESFPWMAGEFELDVAFTDSEGTASALLALEVLPSYDFSIERRLLEPARQGQSYRAEVRGRNGKVDNTWSFTAGALPPGLTSNIKGRNLVLEGTPTQPGHYEFEVFSSGPHGEDRATFRLSVRPARAWVVLHEDTGSCAQTVRLVETTGGNAGTARTLVTRPAGACSEAPVVASFSPDGHHVAFSVWEDGRQALYAADAELEEQAPVLLSRDLADLDASSAYEPGLLWAPDGKHAVVSEPQVDGRYRHVLVDVSLAAPRLLEIDHAARDRAWAASGREFATQRARLDGRIEIATATRSEDAFELVSEEWDQAGEATLLGFDPDDNLILYARHSSHRGIYAFEGGTHGVSLAGWDLPVESASQLRLTPDGTKVVVERTRGERAGILLFDTDLGALHKHELGRGLDLTFLEFAPGSSDFLVADADTFAQYVVRTSTPVTLEPVETHGFEPDPRRSPGATPWADWAHGPQHLLLWTRGDVHISSTLADMWPDNIFVTVDDPDATERPEFLLKRFARYRRRIVDTHAHSPASTVRSLVAGAVLSSVESDAARGYVYYRTDAPSALFMLDVANSRSEPALVTALAAAGAHYAISR